MRTTYPALSMAEAWRELPEDNKELCIAVRDYLRQSGKLDYFKVLIQYIEFLRSIDNLINLIVWLKEQEKP